MLNAISTQALKNGYYAKSKTVIHNFINKNFTRLAQHSSKRVQFFLPLWSFELFFLGILLFLVPTMFLVVFPSWSQMVLKDALTVFLKFSCVPQSMPNRTTLYVISFAQNFTLEHKYKDQRERPQNLPFT